MAEQQLKSILSGGGQVTVFLAQDAVGDKIDQLRKVIANVPGVRSFHFETSDEAYERFKVLFASQPDVINNTSPEALPRRSG